MTLRILMDASVLVSAAFGGIPAQAVKSSFKDHTIIYSGGSEERITLTPLLSES